MGKWLEGPVASKARGSLQPVAVKEVVFWSFIALAV